MNSVWHPRREEEEEEDRSVCCCCCCCGHINKLQVAADAHRLISPDTGKPMILLVKFARFATHWLDCLAARNKWTLRGQTLNGQTDGPTDRPTDHHDNLSPGLQQD